MPTNYDEVLSKFPGVRHSSNGWKANCPVHEGGGKHKPSLWITLGTTGALVVKCKRGCSTDDVLRAVGLKWRDLFPPGTAAKDRKAMGRIAKCYDYRDEQGKLLFQSVRMIPKDFRQRRPDPAKPKSWLWGLADTRMVLYRLPEIVAANRSRRVLIVEGERDADNLARMGFLATTNPMGCCKWDTESDERHGYGKSLEGCECIVIGDNDPVDEKLGYAPGQRHVEMVCEVLKRWASRIRKIPFLPGVPLKGDATDWIAAGGTAAQLNEIIAAAPIVHEALPGTIEMRRTARAIFDSASGSPRTWLENSRRVLNEFDRQFFGATA